MNNPVIIIVSVFIALSISACKKDKDLVEDGVVRVSLQAKWGNENFSAGNIYADPFNRPLLVESFKAFIHNIHVVDEDGQHHQLHDIALVDFNNGLTVEKTLPAGRYTAIGMSAGVPEARNTGQDPAQYPNAHPLSVQQSQGMFWTWNSGYIFIKYEGKVTLEESPQPLTDPFGFHIGTDGFYLPFTFNRSFEVGAQRTDLTIVFDVKKFLQGPDDTIDLSQDFMTHTMSNMSLANRFMSLFGQAVRLQ